MLLVQMYVGQRFWYGAKLLVSEAKLLVSGAKLLVSGQSFWYLGQSFWYLSQGTLGCLFNIGVPIFPQWGSHIGIPYGNYPMRFP